MSNLPIEYRYPANGGYADTVGIMADGRLMFVNTQYSQVLFKHADGCEKGHCALSVGNVCDEGQRRAKALCTCGAVDGINPEALVIDARARGKFGAEPKAKKPEPAYINNTRTHGLSREEIAAAAAKYDAIHNEGGEGFNPYRDL